MKKINILLAASTIICSISISTIPAVVHAEDSISNSVVNSKQQQQIIPQVDHIRVLSGGKVEAYLTKPIPVVDYECQLIYKNSENKDVTIGSPQVANNDGVWGYTSFIIDLNSLVSINKEEIVNSLSFKVLNRSDGKWTPYAVDNKELLTVLRNAITIVSPNKLVTGDEIITGTVNTGTHVSVETMSLTNPSEIIGSATAVNDRYSINLPHATSGLDVYNVVFTGQYGETGTKLLVTDPREKGENLLFNSTMNDGANGWQKGLIKQNQDITNDGEGAVFTTRNGGQRLGVFQIKCINQEFSTGRFKLSLDIKPETILEGKEDEAELMVGNVLPSGLITDGYQYVTIKLTKNDLRKWKHIDMYLTTKGTDIYRPIGFSALNLEKLKVKNISLQQID